MRRSGALHFGGGYVDTDAVATEELSQSLVRILSEESLVLDVGANRGQFARQLLASVSCTVLCLEPVESAFIDLCSLADRESRITPVNLGVAETTGPIDFFVTESDVGSSLLEPVPDQSSKWATFATRQIINATRLDDFIEDRGLEYISLVKTDCQGTDGRVLASAGRFLSPECIGALLVEINFHKFYDGQDSLASIFELAQDHGYFLAGFYRHFNREGWLWWADALFLPDRPPFSTQ